MDVFRINPTVGVGVALVAARDTREAIDFYKSTEYRSFIYGYYNCECDIIVGLTFDTDKPKIILDSIQE